MTSSDPIRNVVIVGGGTAGWMTACALSRFLDDGQRRFTLVESDAIGTIGVGEATIPPIRDFNYRLGIDEAEFLAETKGTIKLAIEFVNWGALGERYLHPFGALGQDIEGIAFHQFWLKHRIGELEDYWLNAALARRNRFIAPDSRQRPPIAYAYHFDAGLYAAFLRRRAEAQGVTRIEGTIRSVERDPQGGQIAAVHLDSGQRLSGDLFIDCSGFRSLLLGETMEVPFVDWSQWLVCDRAVAVPSERTEPLLPYTRSTAHSSGWQWRIPLQHRTGNGVVYSSRFLADQDAEDLLLSNLDGEPLDQPRRLQFSIGMHERLWDGNVVAIGLSGGFIEPLESTAIHLIQTGISRLLWLFPDRGAMNAARREYNRVMGDLYVYIRDFIILHYKATARNDSPFWREMAALEVPDELAHKLELFREHGRVRRFENDLFAPQSWIAVMLGQNIMPRNYDPGVDSMDDARVIEAMQQMHRAIATAADNAPTHAEAIEQALGRHGRGPLAGGRYPPS